jgi:hypothetical protein
LHLQNVYPTLQGILTLMFAPGFPPYDVEFMSVPYRDPPQYDGALKPNKDLENIEYLSDKVDATSLGYLKVFNDTTILDINKQKSRIILNIIVIIYYYIHYLPGSRII